MCCVLDMPPCWSEVDLIQHFTPFGQVKSVRVQRDANGSSHACGFATYATAESANHACHTMDGLNVGGKYLKVSLACFCSIFNMPSAMHEDDLMQLFTPFGQITSSHVQRDTNGLS